MADRMPRTCAACGSPATMQCAGCKDAPEYAPGDALGTFYCNRICQLQHRKTHKTECRNLSRRLALLRAAQLMKSAMLAYREIIYDPGLKQIECKDGILWLHRDENILPIRVALPHHLTNDKEHVEAAMLKDQSDAAMSLQGRMTRKLLSDVPATFEKVNLLVCKPKLPTEWFPPVQSAGPPADVHISMHTVIRVKRLTAGETWILDTAGCQYGLRDVLVPHDKYIEELQGRLIGDPMPYETNEMSDLRYLETQPWFSANPAQQRYLNLEKQARLHFAKFVNSHVAPGLLRGSTQDFEGKRLRLKNQLIAHMRSYNA